MSDNNKFLLYVGLKQLYIIKHSLELYTKRECNENDKKDENDLLKKVNEKIEEIKLRYGI